VVLSSVVRIWLDGRALEGKRKSESERAGERNGERETERGRERKSGMSDARGGRPKRGTARGTAFL
jgi:hypothetical protein